MRKTIEVLKDRLGFLSTKLGAGEFLYEERVVRDVCQAYREVIYDLEHKKI